MGWVDDDLAFVHGWGFAAHGAWLAEHVPGATVVISEAGHLTDPDARRPRLRDLLAVDS